VTERHRHRFEFNNKYKSRLEAVGLLRVVRRESGIRVYAARDPDLIAEPGTADARMDRLVDLVVHKYAPLPAASLGQLLRLLRSGVPQWASRRAAALARAKQRFAHARVDGIEWYWPASEAPASRRWRPDDCVRLLAPFDPVAWDRRRFEILWGWAYRFEAYTPAPKRKLGYYALPLLWRDRMIGWGNLGVSAGALQCSFGYIAGAAPPDPAFGAQLDDEIARIRAFLRCR